MINITPKTWYQVSASRLDSVSPSPVPVGSTGVASVMDAWSGGAFDEVGDQLLIWGGGHTNYAGNEVYTFKLSNLQWSRLTEPCPPNIVSASNAIESTGYYGTSANTSNPDFAQPRSRHTYDLLQCYNGKMYSVVGHALYITAGSAPQTDAFNISAATWSHVASISSSTLYAGVTCLDTSGNIWYTGGGSQGFIKRFNITSGIWIEHNDQFHDTGVLSAGYFTGVYHPPTNRLYAFGMDHCVAWNLDISNNSITHIDVPVSGPRNIVSAVAPGLAYDPISQLIVGWNGGSGVFTFDPNTSAFTKVVLDPSNTVTPTDANAIGTYGRFRYSPISNVFVGVNKTSENVYLFKLNADVGTSGTDVTTLSQVLSGNYVVNRPNVNWDNRMHKIIRM